MFSKAAAGRQLVDRFAPHMEPAALARYGSDLNVLRRGAAAVEAVYLDQRVPAGRFPGIDVYRRHSNAIDQRAQSLLDRVVATEPDYRRVANIGGFDRLPFLLVFEGIVALYAGTVVLAGRRGRGRGAAALAVLASTALIAYPFLSGLDGGAAAGQRMLRSVGPVMTVTEVHQLQSDFVILVTAVGEMDTGFRNVLRPGRAAGDIVAVDKDWPKISSDLASLVGVINDDIADFRALSDLNAVPHRLGLPGFAAYPWMLVGIGCACAALSAAAWPRREREES